MKQSTTLLAFALFMSIDIVLVFTIIISTDWVERANFTTLDVSVIMTALISVEIGLIYVFVMILHTAFNIYKLENK